MAKNKWPKLANPIALPHIIIYQYSKLERQLYCADIRLTLSKIMFKRRLFNVCYAFVTI